MADLKSLYESLGYQNVRTYIQSGNVVFNCTEADVSKLIASIEKKNLETYDFEVLILVLTPKEIEDALNNNPFEEKEKTYFTFLANEPEQEKIDQLKKVDYSPEQYLIKGEVIYVYPPNGYGKTKLNNNFFEKKLKVSATTRNWKTTNKLLEMASS